MKYLGILVAFVALFLFATEEFAEAKRFGSAKSFGGSSIFSSTAPKAPITSGSSSAGFNQSATGAGASAGATTMAGRSGMGLMGGLLAGTFLGSMLMGGPLGGGLLDIILLGLLVYFGLRIFRSFTGQGQQNNGQRQQNAQQYRQNTSAQQSADMWSNLQSSPQANAQEARPQSHGIDTREFTEGAKSAFVRMQESWDARNLQDIALFTTQSVFNEIKKQAMEDPEPSKTEILSLAAQINKIEKDNKADRISVYFTALIREDQENAMPENVTELWHFLREDQNANWKIDGIQQVA